MHALGNFPKRQLKTRINARFGNCFAVDLLLEQLRRSCSPSQRVEHLQLILRLVSDALAYLCFLHRIEQPAIAGSIGASRKACASAVAWRLQMLNASARISAVYSAISSWFDQLFVQSDELNAPSCRISYVLVCAKFLLGRLSEFSAPPLAAASTSLQIRINIHKITFTFLFAPINIHKITKYRFWPVAVHYFPFRYFPA